MFFSRNLSCIYHTTNVASVIPFPGINSNCIPSILTFSLNFLSKTISNTYIPWSNSFIAHFDSHPYWITFLFVYQYEYLISSQSPFPNPSPHHRSSISWLDQLQKCFHPPTIRRSTCLSICPIPLSICVIFFLRPSAIPPSTISLIPYISSRCSIYLFLTISGFITMLPLSSLNQFTATISCLCFANCFAILDTDLYPSSMLSFFPHFFLSWCCT